MTAALTTLTAVKAELNIPASTDDAYLASLIDQASDAVSSFCRRPFGIEDCSDKFFIRSNCNELVLERWPVVSIAQVTVDGVVIASGEYNVDAGILYRYPSWRGTTVVVDYRAGYVLPGNTGRTLPNDIERAALNWIRHLYFARGDDPRVRSDESTGIAARTYFADVPIPVDVELLLSRYRDVSVW